MGFRDREPWWAVLDDVFNGGDVSVSLRHSPRDGRDGRRPLNAVRTGRKGGKGWRGRNETQFLSHALESAISKGIVKAAARECAGELTERIASPIRSCAIDPKLACPSRVARNDNESSAITTTQFDTYRRRRMAVMCGDYPFAIDLRGRFWCRSHCHSIQPVLPFHASDCLTYAKHFWTSSTGVPVPRCSYSMYARIGQRSFLSSCSTSRIGVSPVPQGTLSP
jgi:hypothetical protein